MNLYHSLYSYLKKNPAYAENGEVKKWVVLDKAKNLDEELIAYLLEDDTLKDYFFKEVKGSLVFNNPKFVQFLEQKNYLNDSYTQFQNKTGLNIGSKFLKQRNEVSLVWAYKDCVLEGVQSREEDKKDEIFFNEILAQDEITHLLSPKVLTNAQRYLVDNQLVMGGA